MDPLVALQRERSKVLCSARTGPDTTAVPKRSFSCSPPACSPRRGWGAGKQPSNVKQSSLANLSWDIEVAVCFLTASDFSERHRHLHRVLGERHHCSSSHGSLPLLRTVWPIRGISYYYTFQYEKQNKETTTKGKNTYL